VTLPRRERLEINWSPHSECPDSPNLEAVLSIYGSSEDGLGGVRLSSRVQFNAGSFIDCPPGRYRVACEVAPTNPFQVSADCESLEVAAGAKSEVVLSCAYLDEIVAGTVLGPMGTPVTRLPVRLFISREDGSWGAIAFASGKSTITDSEGRLLFCGVPDRATQLWIWPEQCQSDHSLAYPGTPKTPYIDVPRPCRDIVVRLERGYTLRGTIRIAGRKAEAGTVEIDVARLDSPEARALSASDGGSFSFTNLRRGTYRVRYRDPVTGRVSWTSPPIVVEADADADYVVFKEFAVESP
jgi:hypothetical protein